MRVYIDSDYKCHVTDGGNMREFDVPFFEGKCPAFIEGYRYVPAGESWTRSDGVVFSGEMIAPFVDNRILAAYQSQYEADAAEREDMQTALETVGVSANG